MNKERLNAFSDGVIAIIITIMVLELKAPSATNLDALVELAPVFLSYVLSFLYVAIYWNNHHHMLHLTHSINGNVMWANMHLLFWLSLMPFATAWLNAQGSPCLPTAFYGFILLMAAIAYYVLQTTLIRLQGPNGALAKAIGTDLKGKISPVLYIMGVTLSFYRPWLADSIYCLVALMWLIPDRRIERVIAK